MKLHELKQAYPAVSPDCRDAMLRTAWRVSSEERRTRKLSAALVVAMVMALVLIGAAYAAVRMGIINYLIGVQDPSEGMVKSAQQVEANAKLGDIEVAVTGAMYDGERLSLSWSVANKKPEDLISLRLGSITFGGESVDPEFSSIPSLEYEAWAPAVFGLEEVTTPRIPVNGGMISHPLGKSLTGKQELVVSLNISKPKKSLVMLEPTFEEDYLIEEECPEGLDPQWWAEAAAGTRADALAMLEAMKASGITIADKDHQSAEWWWEQGYIVVDHVGGIVFPEGAECEDFEYGEGNPYGFDGFMEQIGTLTLRFWMDADEGKDFRKDCWAQKESGKDEDIVLPGCTARVKRLSLTPLSTRVLLHLLPMENTEEAARKLEETYGWLEVRDESGRELDFADMEFATWSPLVTKTAEGEWVLEWDWYMAGVRTFPKEIHFGMRADFEEAAELTEEQKTALELFAEKMVFVEVE